MYSLQRSIRKRLRLYPDGSTSFLFPVNSPSSETYSILLSGCLGVGERGRLYVCVCLGGARLEGWPLE